MAIPIVEKTWQYNVNIFLRSTGTAITDHQRLWRTFKDALISFGSNPWTIHYSCNSTTAGTAGDGVDWWTTNGSLIWNSTGSAHSWIVLKQANLAGGNFQFVLDLAASSASYTYGVVAFSANAGFTGGTTLARPTAADEVIIMASGSQIITFPDGSSSTFDCILHVMQSTDGQCTRAFFLHGGADPTSADAMEIGSSSTLAFIADYPKAPVSGWTLPFVFSWIVTSSSGPLIATLTDNAKLYGYQAGSMPMYATSEMVEASMLGELWISYNEISGEWLLTPIGLVSETAGKRGRHGTLFDAWWASGSKIGDSYPNSSARTIVKIAGQLAVPWNGTIPRTHL